MIIVRTHVWSKRSLEWMRKFFLIGFLVFLVGCGAQPNFQLGVNVDGTCSQALLKDLTEISVQGDDASTLNEVKQYRKSLIQFKNKYANAVCRLLDSEGNILNYDFQVNREIELYVKWTDELLSEKFGL